MIKNMIKILRKMMEKDQKSQLIKRAAHSKSLGLLKAYFTIRPDLPDNLRIGLFKISKTYPAFIRFSNSNPKFSSDTFKDFRGFAIKLINDQNSHFPQDFILTSTPKVPLGTLVEFYETIYYGLKNPIFLLLKIIFQGKLNKFIKIYKLMNHDTSPLDIRYWSVTPYMFGNDIVKYVIIPSSIYTSKLPKTLTPSYLTENMQKHLLTQEANFDFFIQIRKDENKMPIDDVSVEWLEKDSPFLKVAEINIPPQTFQTHQRFHLAETLSFSPSNSLYEHRAIGSINEARIIIYKALSAFRQQRNQFQLYKITEADFHSIP
ncbi:MAG: hypothetical protein H6Q70_4357 [Firmicutes bacterium]|nr:hypothetical protein [Bacillota bacterium]